MFKINIRKADIEDLRVISKVYIDTWRTTYKGLIPDKYLNELSYEEAENKWLKFISDSLNKPFTYIASNDKNEVIGFAAAQISSDHQFKGELYALYLLPQAQGLGTGRRLISIVAEHFINEGILSMMVWVMKNNKSGREFYKRLGGKYYTYRESQFGECIVEDSAYFWLNISNLILPD